MRVLYDISTLGLAHLYQQSRGGAFRVALHRAEGLAASSHCELFFCANHSSVAYHGCEAFLRDHPRLGHIPLVAPARSRPPVRALASATHRWIRSTFGRHRLPVAVRNAAARLDAHLHPPVSGGPSDLDIFDSSSVPLPPPARGRKPKRLLTLWDLAFIRFPQLYRRGYRHHLLSALRSLRDGDHVITISNFVRDELLAGSVASADRIHVVPLAADRTIFYRCDDQQRLDSVRRKFGIPGGPYVLGVNTPDPRKNVAHAIHAFACAAANGRGVPASLVLVGSPGPGSDVIGQTIVGYPELRSRIVLTGYVPDEDLAPLYSAAAVFVYCSRYEGFGLPPLEAMQCGTPVIASNTSALPEVVGDAGVMLPPDDVGGLAQAMLDLATDDGRRRDLRRRALARATRFTWEATTAATLQAYREALRS